MTQSSLDYFQKLIDEHFDRENIIMKEMLEADLSKDEWVHLQSFMRAHSHTKFVTHMRRYQN